MAFSLMTAERLVLTVLAISGRKLACTDLVKPSPSPQEMPFMVPTSLSSSFLESATARFSSPEAPSSNGTPVSGSMKRTFSGVPHLMAICTVLLMK